MPVASIIFGLLLCGLSVLGMIGSVEKIATAFVPMMFGIPLVITGIVSLNPHRGRVGLWIAAAIALGGLVTAVSCAVYGVADLDPGEKPNVFAFELVGGLAVLSAGFLLIWLFALIRYRLRVPRRWRGLPRASRPTGRGGRPRADAANPS